MQMPDKLKRRAAGLALSLLALVFTRLPYHNRFSRFLDVLLCIEEDQRIR
jgi:hypothetical protein